jgi:hypothetical protein
MSIFITKRTNLLYIIKAFISRKLLVNNYQFLKEKPRALQIIFQRNVKLSSVHLTGGIPSKML